MMSFDERQAWKIYEAFRCACQSHKIKNHWQITNIGLSGLLDPRDFCRVRNHRNWRHYMGAWLRFGRFREFRPRDLMDAVFRSVGSNDKVYPGMLNTASAERAYIEHTEARKAIPNEQSDEAQRIEECLIGTHRTIQSRVGELTAERLWSFFNKPKEGADIGEGMVLAIHNMLSFYYLAISKSFENAWRTAEPRLRAEIALDDQKVQLIRARVRLNEGLHSCAKRLFGDDIV